MRPQSITLLVWACLLIQTLAQTCDNDVTKTSVALHVVADAFPEIFPWVFIANPTDELTSDTVLATGLSGSYTENVCLKCDSEYMLKVYSVEGHQPSGNFTATVITGTTLMGYSAINGFVATVTITIPCVCQESETRVQLVVDHEPNQEEGSLVWAIHQYGESGVLFSGNSNSDALVCLPCDETVFISATHCQNTRSCQSFAFKLFEEGYTTPLVEGDASSDVVSYPYTNWCIPDITIAPPGPVSV